MKLHSIVQSAFARGTVQASETVKLALTTFEVASPSSSSGWWPPTDTRYSPAKTLHRPESSTVQYWRGTSLNESELSAPL